jgi:DHA1 family multidrug resistance protein-like MFS transporter
MRQYINELKSLSIGVRRFIISEILLGIGIGLFTLVLNLHLLDLGITAEQIGKVTSIGALAMGLIGIPSGLLANYWGRKNMLVCGIALMGLSYLTFGLGTVLWIFYAAQIIQSIGVTLLVTSEIQLLFRYGRSKQEETQSYSLLFGVFTLFTGVGTLIGGVMPRWIGGHTTVYQSALLLSAGLLFLNALVRAIWLPKEPVASEIEPKIRQDLVEASAKKLTGNKSSIWILSIFILLSGFAFGWIGNFFNIIIKFRLLWSDEWVSLALTANGLILFAGSLFMPYLFKRWGITRSFFGLFSLNIILALTLYLIMPNPLFIGLALARSGLYTLLNNMIESQSMSTISEQKRNLFAGMRSVFRSLGFAGSTYISGIILSKSNYTLPFLWTGLVLCVNLVFFWIWVRPLLEHENSTVDTA